MTSSLARQLAQLRTPGAVAASTATTATYSGPFLFPEAEAEHTSLESLRCQAAESLAGLVAADPGLARYIAHPQAAEASFLLHVPYE